MTLDHTITNLDEPGLVRLAQLLAFTVRPGDLIALHGDLGAGKTTFARAFIRALTHPAATEVPSPTFTLLQTYATPRLKLAHFDLYRLNDPSELDELGLDEAISQGAAIVEWPERAASRLTGTRLDIAIAESTTNADTRDITLTGESTWGPRLDRLIAIRDFLAGAGHAADTLHYLQGDASPRRYARLTAADGTPTILMDWPRQPDGPPIRNGLPYSRIAHLAEDVRPFVAIGQHLASQGFSTPAMHAHDLDAGLLVIADFGDAVFGSTMGKTASQADLWRTGVDTLIALRAVTPPATLPLPDGTTVTMPAYDHQALAIETELLLDWYWPAVHGSPVPANLKAEFTHLWSAIFDRLQTLPHGWALRDYHSPNLLALPDRAPPKNVGIIDFQDAQIGPHAYDLVSLLQDARVDVPATLEAELLAHYCNSISSRDPAFQRPSFEWSYAALGAQRNSKILGIFARLAHRDGKPAYLAHIPRIWSYLARDLAHPELTALAAWYDHAFPAAVRAKPVSPTLTRASA
ncbi:MAG: tRNA (adenosine(37)-N6)-threonylcarbamoyltransferase complex ATPase subunit type 1 TsaE [Hyphomicrobiaceae bacterium]